MLQRSVTLVLVWFLFQGVETAQAKPTTYHIRTEDSNVGFTILKWVVFKEEGRFRDYAGTITYGPDNPSETRIDLTIKTASVDSRNRDRDEVIKSSDFLHAARFPEMRFRSTEVRTKGKDTLLVSGDFTIKDVTKRITVPVRVTGVARVGDMGELIGFETSFTIDRTHYGIAPGMTMIGKEVTIHLLIGAASGPSSAWR